MRKAIAIDFDGCLCTNEYLAIGQPNWAVINRAKAEQRRGAGLILWTCREDELLLDALAACEEWDLTFDAVNESLPDWTEEFKTWPRKVGATEYWDDKAVNPTTLNGTYVSIEWFNQVNAELQAYKKADEARCLLLLPDVKYTDADGEEALRVASWICGNRNNPVTRYTLDAIAEKLCRDADQQKGFPDNPLSLDELRRMDGEPVWGTHGVGWKICYGLTNHRGYLCMETGDGGFICMDHYGKDWLAYSRKPKMERR